MRDARILPLLGPAAVLYLVADVAAAGDGLSLVAGVIAAVAAFVSLAPLVVRKRSDVRGARRVGVLGVALGVSLVSCVRPDVLSLAADLARSVAVAAAGALILDLALTVPDVPRALDRGRLPRLLVLVLAILSGAVGLASALPVFDIFGSPVIVPPGWGAAPLAFAAVAVAIAAVVRALRRHMGSAPEVLAASAWALLGLVPAALIAGALVLVPAAGLAPSSSPWVRGLAAAAAALIAVGHVAMLDPSRRLASGKTTRVLLAATLALGAVAIAVAALRAYVPSEPFTIGLAVIATALVALGAFRVAAPVVEAALAPASGRLLRAVDEAMLNLGTATDLGEVASAVLAPLRRSARSQDVEIFLYTRLPDREATIGAAGEPHVRACPMPEALARGLEERPSDIVVRAPLERLVVRRPELRELVELLVDVDALCVVPLVAQGELEGALVIPRGRRRSTLSLEELSALRDLATRLAAVVSILSAQTRAQERAGRADATRKGLEDRIETLSDEVDRLRADAGTLSRGRAADRIAEPPIAYSPAMRALTARVVDIGPLDAPVLLVGDPGSDIDRIAHMVHQHSGRSEGAFVIADCGAIRGERTAAALLGEEQSASRPGWLRLAAGGTLLLVDVPALSLEAQRELAEAVAAKQARPVDGAGAYPVDARIIATSRVPLDALAEVGAFDAELARWLCALRLDVPPLRERTEDLASIVLLALDRACRVHGRDVVGIDADAQRALEAHAWPGNLRELQHVIDRAVAASTGAKVRLADLPPLAAAAAPAAAEHPLDGTYAELERKVLVHALSRAGGNKSEAARLLGLKRTTFLDKLRRFELTELASRISDEHAA